MFDAIARELGVQFSLGHRARPFVQLVLANMTDPEQGGLAGFVQRLRSLGPGWDPLVASWLSGDIYGHKPMSAMQVEQAFGGPGGLLGALASRVGVGRELAVPALVVAVPALLSRFARNGQLEPRLTPQAQAFIGDRRQWTGRLAPVVTMVAPASRGHRLPWIVAGLAAALLLGSWWLLRRPAETAPPARTVAPARPASASAGPAAQVHAAVAPPHGANRRAA